MARARITPRVKVWIEVEGGASFGSGLIAILQAVDASGSIKEAAARLGRSYRHVWDRVKDAERALGRSLVETQVGGHGPQRSGLTDDARLLIADFLSLRERMIEAMERESAARFH